jgi:hypothetical protein
MAMKRDPRPVSQQVVSGLKIGALLLVGIGVVVCLSYIPVHRIEASIPVRRIEAHIWHLRHGNTIDVGQYRVPVPMEWYVEPRISDGVMLIDLNTGDSTFVQTSGLPKGRTLSSWADFVSRASAISATMKTTRQRNFNINGETFLCIEQEVDIGPRLGHIYIYPIQCLSDGGLEVRFQSHLAVGRMRYATFYSLLQRVQKL